VRYRRGLRASSGECVLHNRRAAPNRYPKPTDGCQVRKSTARKNHIAFLSKAEGRKTIWSENRCIWSICTSTSRRWVPVAWSQTTPHRFRGCHFGASHRTTEVWGCECNVPTTMRLASWMIQYFSVALSAPVVMRNGPATVSLDVMRHLFKTPAGTTKFQFYR
jgi:hypothetical protein